MVWNVFRYLICTSHFFFLFSAHMSFVDEKASPQMASYDLIDFLSTLSSLSVHSVRIISFVLWEKTCSLNSQLISNSVPNTHTDSREFVFSASAIFLLYVITRFLPEGRAVLLIRSLKGCALQKWAWHGCMHRRWDNVQVKLNEKARTWNLGRHFPAFWRSRDG